MTWEEADLISKYPRVNEALRRGAERNMQVPALQQLKKDLEALEEKWDAIERSED